MYSFKKRDLENCPPVLLKMKPLQGYGERSNGGWILGGKVVVERWAERGQVLCYFPT